MAAAAGPLIEVRHLRTWFPAQAGLLARVKDHVKAVDDVSFDIERGEVAGAGRRIRFGQDHGRPQPVCA